jgi:parallel beta-helix repeat protein
MGAIRGIDYDRTQSTSGWTLDSVEVSYSKSIGVKAGNRMRILRSNLHHNGTINIGGSGVGIVVDGTQSSYGNNGCPNNPGFEAGGSKFALTDSLIIRNSTFSNNCGPGLWLDINNIHYLLEGNRADSNAREGIVVEISYQGVIRNNSVSRNGTGDPYRSLSWLWDAGIGVHASQNVEVYGNTVTENFNGIVAIQQKRGAAYGDPAELYGPYIVQNLYVHDNTIYQRTPAPAGVDGSFSGAVQDVGDNAIYTSRNNRFVHNTYYTGTRAYAWAWMNVPYQTAAAWRGYGQDATGSFNP